MVDPNEYFIVSLGSREATRECLETSKRRLEEREPEKAYTLVSPIDYRALVEAMDRDSLSSIVTVIGERGLRKSEASTLK